MFSLANPLGGEQEVAATETPPNRLGVTLLTLARALERIYEILQPPAPQAADDQARGEEVHDQPPVSTTRSHGREPLIHRATHSHIPAPVGERAKRAIPQDVKITVSARDGGRCRQCGSTQQLHFDHVIPISRGGANTVANIQLLCGACNRAKGAKLELTPLQCRRPAHQVVLPRTLHPELNRTGPSVVGPLHRPRGHRADGTDRREHVQPQPPAPVLERVDTADQAGPEQRPGEGPPQRC
jgi:hypothetical protein